MVAGLQNGGGDGGQGVEDGCGRTGLQQAHRQILQFPQAGEKQVHNGPGQHGQAHGAGDGDGHIQLQHGRHLPVRLPAGAGHRCGNDPGNGGGGQSRGDCHRQVDQLVILGVENALQRTDGGVGQTAQSHQVAEEKVVQGIADLIDGLAEDYGDHR